MARSMQDVTTIYRFKVTTTGVHDRDGYGKVKGQAFEYVDLIGPYTRKVPFQSWINTNHDVKVERQQLAVVGYLGELGWHTIEIKFYEKENEDD